MSATEYLLNQLPGRKLPKWQRTYFVDEAGVLYLPADIAGDSLVVTMTATYDGTRNFLAHKHVYFPAEWLAREFPDCKEICDAAAAHIDRMRAQESDESLYKLKAALPTKIRAGRKSNSYDALSFMTRLAAIQELSETIADAELESPGPSSHGGILDAVAILARDVRGLMEARSRPGP